MSGMPDYLTIEEAARRLGISVATARRWAGSGRIPASKSGKQWVVDGTRLPSPIHRRQASLGSTLDLAAALVHVRRTDLSELSVPDVLRYSDQLADEEAVLAAAKNRLAGSPGPAIEVDVDKNSLFTRRTIQIDVEDRIAYQAAIASIATRIESQTPDAVYSARLSTDRRYFLARGTKAWVRWRHAVLRQLEPNREWMVATDLTSYFDTIPHRSLIAEIESLNVDPNTVSAIRGMLMEWAPTEGFGLPQGPNASRLLGNLYLLPVDRAMLEHGWAYSRYLDDVRIVTASRAEAVNALRQFQSECRMRGLIVSSAKTQLLHGAEARAALVSDDDLAAADYLMEANNSRLARKALKKILKRALKHEAHLDTRRARFSLYRLGNLREGAVLKQVLSHLEDLAPIASVVGAYLPPFITRDSVVSGIGDFLADEERSYSPYGVTWLLATMLEHPDPLPAPWIREAARRLKDRNQPVYLRAVAAVVVARSGRRADIDWIKRDIQREHHPTVLRGYAVGLHWAGALGRQTEKQLVTRSPRLTQTVDYLRGRAQLPSLIYRDRSLVLPH
jgi:excisionase family DNA binding protein